MTLSGTPTDLFRTRHMKGVMLTKNEGDALVGNPQFEQASHGFSVGDVIRRTDLSTHAKAQADSDVNIGHGLALVIWVDGDNFSVIRLSNHQVVEIPGIGTGRSTGTELFLSDDIAGLMTEEANVDVGRRIYLGFVVEGDQDFFQWEPGWIRD